jgi:hypothetical protein
MLYRMDKKNVVSVYLYTASMGPWDLHVAAADFILQHFEQASHTTLLINGKYFFFVLKFGDADLNPGWIRTH